MDHHIHRAVTRSRYHIASNYNAKTISLLLVTATVASSSIVAIGQVRVDATGPVRESKTITDVVEGGGVFSRVPLTLTIQEVPRFPIDGDARIEFRLVNSGKTNISIPISPDPADFDPLIQAGKYKVHCLALRISYANSPAIILRGGADLFGSVSVPGTLVEFTPGSSIVVLARVALPTPTTPASRDPLVASAVLTEQLLTKTNGKTVLTLQELGSTLSLAFTVRDLSMSSDSPP